MSSYDHHEGLALPCRATRRWTTRITYRRRTPAPSPRAARRPGSRPAPTGWRAPPPPARCGSRRRAATSRTTAASSPLSTWSQRRCSSTPGRLARRAPVGHPRGLDHEAAALAAQSRDFPTPASPTIDTTCPAAPNLSQCGVEPGQLRLRPQSSAAGTPPRRGESGTAPVISCTSSQDVERAPAAASRSPGRAQRPGLLVWRGWWRAWPCPSVRTAGSQSAPPRMWGGVVADGARRPARPKPG